MIFLTTASSLQNLLQLVNGEVSLNVTKKKNLYHIPHNTLHKIMEALHLWPVIQKVLKFIESFINFFLCFRINCSFRGYNTPQYGYDTSDYGHSIPNNEYDILDYGHDIPNKGYDIPGNFVVNAPRYHRKSSLAIENAPNAESQSWYF